MTGYIRKIEHGTLLNLKIKNCSEIDFHMEHEDYYQKILRLHGYEYLDDFKLIRRIQPFSAICHTGQIEWRSNWASFIDAMMQMFLIVSESRELYLPISIRKIVIDTQTHHSKTAQNHPDREKIDGKIFLNADLNKHRNVYSCGGIQIFEPEARVVNRRKQTVRRAIETFKFIPHFPTNQLSINDAINFCCQLFVENLATLKQNIVEVDHGLPTIISRVNDTLSNLQFAAQECFLITDKKDVEMRDVKLSQNIDELITIVSFLVLQQPPDEDYMNKSAHIINDCLMLFRCSILSHVKMIKTPENVQLVAKIRLADEKWYIYFKKAAISIENIGDESIFEVPSDTHDFSWTDELNRKIQDVRIFHGRSTKKNCSGIDAFYKSILKDFNLKNTQCVFINDKLAPEFDIRNPIYFNHLKLGMSLNMYQNGTWGSFKHLDYPSDVQLKSHEKHCFVNVTQKGDLNSIKWLNGDLDPLRSDLISIHFGSLNFKDLLIATRRIAQDKDSIFNNQFNCGFEYSGVDDAGRKVIGVVKSRALSNFVQPDKYLTFYAHEDWSLEEAATVPLAYLTVYYAFFIHANVQAGESILIHSATGGLGQAAIRTALNHGLVIFATVGSDEKKIKLMEIFPELVMENIGNSHDTSFEEMIMDRTLEKGVDYVLNSLIDDKLQASIRCLKIDGTFLEVGRYDMEMGNSLSLKHFIRQINFKTVYVSHKNIDNMPDVLRKKLLSKIQEDINSKAIQPLTRTVYDANDVQKSFRYLSTGKHIGKILLKIRDNGEMLPIELYPRVNFYSEKSYLVTGGLGGIGIELCDWMILRGCRKLVLASRRGISNSYQNYKIR